MPFFGFVAIFVGLIVLFVFFRRLVGGTWGALFKDFPADEQSQYSGWKRCPVSFKLANLFEFSHLVYVFVNEEGIHLSMRRLGSLLGKKDIDIPWSAVTQNDHSEFVVNTSSGKVILTLSDIDLHKRATHELEKHH